MKTPSTTIATWHNVVDPRRSGAVFSLTVDSHWLDKFLSKHLPDASGEPWHLWLTRQLLEELRAAKSSDELPASPRDRFLHLLHQDVDEACRFPLALTFRTRPERKSRAEKPTRMILILPSGPLIVCQIDEPRRIVTSYFHWSTTRRFDAGEALNSSQAVNRTIRGIVRRYCTSCRKDGHPVLQWRDRTEDVVIESYGVPGTTQTEKPGSREVHWDFEFITPRNWGLDDSGVFTNQLPDYGRREIPKTGFGLGIVGIFSDHPVQSQSEVRHVGKQ